MPSKYILWNSKLVLVYDKISLTAYRKGASGMGNGRHACRCTDLRSSELRVVNDMGMNHRGVELEMMKVQKRWKVMIRGYYQLKKRKQLLSWM